jgi:hypothetical protein
MKEFIDIQELLTHIAETMQTESSFLSSKPTTTVEVISLLDKIADLRGINRDSNGLEFNEICNNLNL